MRADSDQTPSSYGIDADRTEIIVRPGGVLNIESTGPGRPVFTSTNKTRGSWYGIRVLNGGSIKGGIGARIEYAQVGLTIDTVTTADTLRGFNIRTCQIAGVITRSDAVAFENDTISDVPNGYGIQVDHADPSVTGVQISNCQYGIYAVASESRVRGSRIVGPGSYGIYNAQDADLPSDYDTLYVSNVSDSGYFTGAHMYAAYKAHAIVDSCRFVTDTTPGVRSAYGVKAGQSVSIKLRRSLIKGFGTAGFHSFKSKANLGKTKQNNGGSEDPGDNSVHAVPVWFYDEELGWWSIDPKRVSHTGNTSTDTLRAENNWWGSSGPQSKWFTSLVDYNPNLTTDPGLGKIAPGALVSESHALPRDFTLGQNYPNPFNGTTVIEYEIHVAGKVRLSIFNVLGQLVRSLVDESQDAGRHRAEWNGRDERGRELASGVYFYRMQSERQVNSKKMVLLK